MFLYVLAMLWKNWGRMCQRGGELKVFLELVLLRARKSLLLIWDFLENSSKSGELGIFLDIGRCLRNALEK